MRCESGISQTTLAKMLEVSTGFIGQVESKNNSAKYNLNHLNQLAKIFNCSLAKFFPDEFLVETGKGRSEVPLSEES